MSTINSFYKLTEDYSCESAPYLSEEKTGEIVRRVLRAKDDCAYLLLIVERLISFHISKIEHVRCEGYPIFEDRADRESYIDECHAEMIRRAMEDKENASTRRS